MTRWWLFRSCNRSNTFENDEFSYVHQDKPPNEHNQSKFNRETSC